MPFYSSSTSGETGRGPCSSVITIEVVLTLIRSEDCKNSLVLALPQCHGLAPSLLPRHRLVSDCAFPS